MGANLDVIAMGSIVCPGGVPAWAWQTGFLAAVGDTGVGVYTITLEGGGADQNECSFIVTPNETVAASARTHCGVVHTSDTVKVISIVVEDAAGAPTIAYDGPCNVLVVRRAAGDTPLECIAAGFLNFVVGGTPNWGTGNAQFGFAPIGAVNITDNGVGDWTVRLAGGGADAAECVVMICSGENLAVSSMTSYGVVHTSDTDKRITCMQEAGGGGASVAYDGPCVVTVWKRVGLRDGLNRGGKVIAAGRFDSQAGAPAWFWQEGFTAAITRNAAGDYDLTLDRPCNIADCMILVTSAETMAAQRATAFGVTQTSDTVKRITTMQETGAGGGGASAAADVDFNIVVLKRAAG